MDNWYQGWDSAASAADQPSANLADEPASTDDLALHTEQGTPKPKFNVEDFDVDARQLGWKPKEQLDYATASANFKDQQSHSNVPQWSSQAQKYEWHDEFGEVGPEDPALEKALFEDTHRPQKGEYFNVLQDIKVKIEGPREINQVTMLEDAGFHPILLENLKRSQYDIATPIQAFTIPAVLTGSDILGVAQTGSGKTIAYLAPVISRLMGKADKLCKPKPHPDTYDQRTNGITAEPLVLILVPTRELAMQVYNEARRLCYRSKLRPCTVYGGGPRPLQINDLMRGCDILIGTPGRVCDLVTNCPGVVSLKRLKHTIFDEADELMDPDWESQMAPMLFGATAHHSEDRQFIMFSATFGLAAREAAQNYLDPFHFKISVGRVGSSHRNIHQVIVYTLDELKRQCLIDILKAMPIGRTMIFCGSISRTIEVDDFLYRLNFPCNALHSELTQREREEALDKFRRGSSPILVTTHVGGRGLDFEGLQHVINYDLPSAMHGGIGIYAHLIGRTGRIGNQGQATSFYNERNEDIAEDLAKFLMECSHELPDFLEPYKPKDGIIKWEDDSPQEAGSAENVDGSNFDGGEGFSGNGAGWGDESAVKTHPAKQETWSDSKTQASSWEQGW